jgi:hypothetical protein
MDRMGREGRENLKIEEKNVKMNNGARKKKKKKKKK